MNIVWTIWIVGILVSFVVLETYALTHNRTTLSRYVWRASAAFPPLPFLIGVGVGFLACHFWWGGIVHFDPVGG